MTKMKKHITEPLSATEIRKALGITAKQLADAREAIANTEPKHSK